MCSECQFIRCPSGCPNAPETIHSCAECGEEIQEQYYTQDGIYAGCDGCVAWTYTELEFCPVCGVEIDGKVALQHGAVVGCEGCMKQHKVEEL